MIVVVAAVIERGDRRLLIGQRRRDDTSPFKWEFPGGKVEAGETPEAALARELREELGATMTKCVELGRVQHRYENIPDELDVRFFAAAIVEEELSPSSFEQVAWVLPRELANYDFLTANGALLGQLATGRIKVGEILKEAGS